MKKISWLIIIVALICLVLIGFYTNIGKEEQSNSPIKIGFIGSLTGDLQSWGEESRNSIEIAINEINNSNGVNGRKIEITYEDGKCESPATTNATQKLLNINQVDILITYCSLETMTAAPITEQNKKLLFAPAATSPNVTNAGNYVFRLAPSDESPAKDLAKLLSSSYKKIAIVTEVSDFSIGFRDVVLESLEKDTEIVFNELFSGDMRDFRSIVSKLSSKKPDAIVVNANSPITEGLLVKQMDELGILGNRYGIYWGADPEFLEITGDSAEGFAYYNFIANTNDSEVQKFLNNYKKIYGNYPPNPQFAILSYDSIYILKEALFEVGTNSKKLRDYLYKTEFDGLSGKGIHFDRNGDSVGIKFKLFEVQNGGSILYRET